MNFLKLIFITLLTISVGANAQGDLDDIFDDGTKGGFTFSVGTDILTSFAGAPNIFGAARHESGVSIYTGIGIMPLGYVTNARTFVESLLGELNPYGNVQNGFYYNIGGSYLPQNIFYYGEFRMWNINLGEEVGPVLTTLKRRQIAFGSGYRFEFVENKVGADIQIGLSVERVRETIIGNTEKKTFQSGIDIGLSVDYTF